MNSTSTETFGKHLSIILKKMCSTVGADYNAIDFKAHDWFRKYKWTCAEEKDFEKWLTDYIYKNKEARLELCDRRIINKSWCLKVAKEFTFMYGWSLSDYPPPVHASNQKCKK